MAPTRDLNESITVFTKKVELAEAHFPMWETSKGDERRGREMTLFFPWEASPQTPNSIIQKQIKGK